MNFAQDSRPSFNVEFRQDSKPATQYMQQPSTASYQQQTAYSGSDFRQQPSMQAPSSYGVGQYRQDTMPSQPGATFQATAPSIHSQPPGSVRPGQQTPYQQSQYQQSTKDAPYQQPSQYQQQSQYKQPSVEPPSPYQQSVRDPSQPYVSARDQPSQFYQS